MRETKQAVSAPEYNFNDYIPTWGKWGPWPFELGIAGMLLWLAEAFQRVPALRARFNRAAFPLFDWIGEYTNEFSMFLALVATAIIFGFILRVYNPRISKICRAVGLMIGSIIFGTISYSFLSVFPWSMGGIGHLFISWRVATVAIVHMRGVTHNAREPS